MPLTSTLILSKNTFGWWCSVFLTISERNHIKKWKKQNTEYQETNFFYDETLLIGKKQKIIRNKDSVYPICVRFDISLFLFPFS